MCGIKEKNSVNPNKDKSQTEPKTKSVLGRTGIFLYFLIMIELILQLMDDAQYMLTHLNLVIAKLRFLQVLRSFLLNH